MYTAQPEYNQWVVNRSESEFGRFITTGNKPLLPLLTAALWGNIIREQIGCFFR